MTDSHRDDPNALRVRRMGIDTYQEPVVYMRADCHICKSQGFEAHSRVMIRYQERSIIATLNVVHDQQLLDLDEVGLSKAAWRLLGPGTGERVALSHPAALESLSHVRAKVYGQRLGDIEMTAIVGDIAAGRYADIHISARRCWSTTSSPPAAP